MSQKNKIEVNDSDKQRNPSHREERLVRPLRLTDGKRFTNRKGGWIEISWQCENLVCYNQSGGCYWQGGRLQCTKTKFRKMLSDGNYLPNASAMTSADEKTAPKETTL